MDYKLCKDCKGFCCDDIGLSISPNELKISYHTWIVGTNKDLGTKYMAMCLDSKGLVLWHDVWLVYPMLVFSHVDNIHPDGDIKTDVWQKIYHYSCKHHNKKTKECDIYEERPMMCRTFPDSGFCGYRKVTDKRVKSFRPGWFKLGMSIREWDHNENTDKEGD